MGLFDLLTGRKQTEEWTRALIGAYTFSRLKDEGQKQVIIVHICRMLSESGPFRPTFDEAQREFNKSPAIVQAGFMVNAMIDLSIPCGVRGYQWDYIPNPFALKYYSEKARKSALVNIMRFGINPKECFGESKEIYF